MDERTLVPAMLPIVTLNGHSSIPSNLPLESIAARVVVPRDIQREAYSVVEDVSVPLQITEMDQRIAVPQGSEPPQTSAALPVAVDTELVDPDIFMTGEVRLIASPPSPEKARADLFTRISSVVLHVLLIAAILLQARLFPKREPTAEEVDIARKQLTLAAAAGSVRIVETVAAAGAAAAGGACGSAGVAKESRRRFSLTPVPTPAPAPVPEKPARELPSAPVPQPHAVPPEPQHERASGEDGTPKPGLKLETPETPQPRAQLQLPKDSPSRSIQDSLRDASRNPTGGGRAGGVIGPMPRSAPSQGGGRRRRAGRGNIRKRL